MTNGMMEHSACKKLLTAPSTCLGGLESLLLSVLVGLAVIPWQTSAKATRVIYKGENRLNIEPMHIDCSGESVGVESLGLFLLIRGESVASIVRALLLLYDLPVFLLQL